MGVAWSGAFSFNHYKRTFVMQLTGKLIAILPEQSGAGKNGAWKKQDIVIETSGQYPKKVCVSFWGDKLDRQMLQLGTMLSISFDVESREYNGKWYTDVKGWKAEVAGRAESAPYGGGDDAGSWEPPAFEPTSSNEECPF